MHAWSSPESRFFYLPLAVYCALVVGIAAQILVSELVWSESQTHFARLTVPLCVILSMKTRENWIYSMCKGIENKPRDNN